jgi:hypothetical protein
MSARLVAPMLTVVCVKWGDKYGPNYVTKLKSMCRRNLPQHQFLCITEAPVDGVWCSPLLCDLSGWWQKLGLFQPGRFCGDVLYLDLDVVITKPLHGMVELLDRDRSRLWALDDFGYPLTNPRQGIGSDTERLLGGVGTVNSSVMMWNGDAASDVWRKFTPEVMDVLHGDQNFITQALWPNINLIPPEWASSYKYGGTGAIRVFHGDPKPPQVTDKWVLDHWR